VFAAQDIMTSSIERFECARARNNYAMLFSLRHDNHYGKQGENNNEKPMDRHSCHTFGLVKSRVDPLRVK
jgi:hypothetical protein